MPVRIVAFSGASPLQTVADLRGKKVALNKGSNVHYLLVRALEKSGLSLADITPVYLAPADARAAFERGAVEAWARDNTDAVARELAPSVGIPAPILAVALKRQGYGIRTLDEPVVAEQQRIADTFHGLGLVPKAPAIADAVRKPGS